MSESYLDSSVKHCYWTHLLQKVNFWSQKLHLLSALGSPRPQGGQHSQECNRTWQRPAQGSNLLLCTVDQLVLVGSLKAGLHPLIIPQLLHVIKELLRLGRGTRKHTSGYFTKWKVKRNCKTEAARRVGILLLLYCHVQWRFSMMKARQLCSHHSCKLWNLPTDHTAHRDETCKSKTSTSH